MRTPTPLVDPSRDEAPMNVQPNVPPESSRGHQEAWSQTGDGIRFPTPPFNVTVSPIGDQPMTTNAEILRVTAPRDEIHWLALSFGLASYSPGGFASLPTPLTRDAEKNT
jgi:hypothetical protein